MNVTVFAVQKWKIQDNDTTKEGITVHFVDLADYEDEPDKKGVFPVSITAKTNLFSKFTELPAKYDFSLGLSRGSGGKGKPILKNASLIPKSEIPKSE